MKHIKLFEQMSPESDVAIRFGIWLIQYEPDLHRYSEDEDQGEGAMKSLFEIFQKEQ